MIAINFTPCESDKLFLGENQVEFVKESKILGVWIDKDLSWKRQINDTRSKAWFAWKKIKNLCSKNNGLKLATIVNLVKISVLPTMLYCSPVWGDRNANEFKDLWYDILKTATGASCKPSQAKLEVLCSLIPLDITIKNIITKFWIKNYMDHEEDILTTEIRKSIADRGHFVYKHGQYVKEYISERLGKLNGSHRLNLSEHRFNEIATYTKTTMWIHSKTQWENKLKTSNEEENFSNFLSSKSMRTPCSRSNEVYLLSLMHGKIALNSFLYKLKLVNSPMCTCGKDEENSYHVLFQCEEFDTEREQHDLKNEFPLLLNLLIEDEVKLGKQKITNICKLIEIIKATKKAEGRKELKDYFDKNKR